jgi:hypothetical protein
MSQNRYKGEPKRLYDFMQHFAVLCPKCKHEGKVALAHFLDTNNAVFKCTHCFFSEKASERIRYRSTAKAKCGNCLAKLNINVEGRKTIPKYIIIVCPECIAKNRVAENWEAYIQKYNQSGIIDPVFGLPLYYQTKIKEEIFWAYNKNHLNAIRDYVSSELRERTTYKFNMTMVEKLPQFIKNAKNREDVIKAIDRFTK